MCALVCVWVILVEGFLYMTHCLFSLSNMMGGSRSRICFCVEMFMYVCASRKCGACFLPAIGYYVNNKLPS